MSPVMSVLGDITNQLSSVQNALVSLDSKVDVLSEKTQTLAKRLATLEEATEQHPLKKKRVQIPPELSVSIYYMSPSCISLLQLN